MSALLDSLITAAATDRVEPTWLRDARAEALRSLQSEGLPTQRNEAWKYTALRALEARSFAVASDATPLTDKSFVELPGVNGPRVVFVNGVFSAELSRLEDLPAGLSIATLAQELRANPEPLRFLLTRHYAGRGEAFARLNTALAGDGVLLRVAPDVQVLAPVHLVHVGAPAQGDVAWALRHLVELGQGSALTLIEHHLGDTNAHFGNLVSQFSLQANARLHLVQLQEAAAACTLVRRTEMDLGESARVDATTLELGGALVRHDVQARMRGARAHWSSRGCFSLSARQHVDTQLDVRHEARDTSCDVFWRGLADQRARGVFRGAITIAAGGDGSAAALSNKNLLLSPHAEIDTQPVLEIYADEVQASHGATVGQLDERALFYLRSRGLPQVQARAMLIAAFCREALDGVADARLREHLAERLLAHLPGEG
jgi:Fe-S cluster assembly protein SufD